MAAAKPFFKFNPSPEDVLMYYLPRWVHGEPLRDTAEIIREAPVYGCEPKDLAGQFLPVPKTGDRFFFTWCKRQKGRGDRMVRAAGAGTWVSQTKKEITNKAGQKIGCRDNLRFKKGGVYTDWLMEEYRCCLGEAIVGDAERVLCKLYVSPRAPPESAARQESAAVLRQEPAPPVPALAPRPEPMTTHTPKRPAPVAEPPCPKRMRGADAVPIRPVVQPACVTAFAPPRPWCAPQRQAPFPTAPPASCLPRPSVATRPVAPPACLPVAAHRPLMEAPAAADDDDDFANLLEGIIEAEDEMPIEESITSQNCPAAEADDDMGQFASSLEDMLDGTEEGALPTGQLQNPAAEADDDMDQFASSLEEDLMLPQTAAAAAAEEQTAEVADVPDDEPATRLRDFLARYGETESEAAAANELHKAFDVLNDLDDDQIHDAFLTVPLEDYNDQLFY